MWDLNQFGIEVGGEGEHVFSFRTDLADDEAEQHLLLILERLGEEQGASFDARLEDANLQQISTVASVRTFVGRLSGDTRAITLRLWTGARERFRVTWVRFLKKFRGTAAELKCKGCKFLIQALASAALSAAGAPFALGTVVVLAPEQRVALESLCQTVGPLADFIEATAALSMWGALQKVWSALNWAFELSDKLFGAVCRLIGLCPPLQAGDPNKIAGLP